jgi:ABC-type branched-subunit amino acid transport system substrate-binding protein
VLRLGFAGFFGALNEGNVILVCDATEFNYVSTSEVMRLIIGLSTLLAVCLSLSIGELQAEENNSTVGVVAPLSGYIASMGSAVRNGITLAQRDKPELFNAVNFRFEDDQHDPKLALTAYRQLRAHSTPKAIMAFGFFFPTVTGRALLQDQVPLINLSAVAKPAIGNPHIIRSMNHTAQYGKALAEFLASEGQLEYPVMTTEYDPKNGSCGPENAASTRNHFGF